jgi:hypothetical protein
MLRVLASSGVNRGLMARSGQPKYYKIDICYPSTTHAPLRSKRNNVFEWSDMSSLGLSFPHKD